MGLTKIVGLLMNLDLPAVSSPDQSTDPIIRTIIADDERLAREKLRIFLASEANVKLVAECSDGKLSTTCLSPSTAIGFIKPSKGRAWNSANHKTARSRIVSSVCFPRSSPNGAQRLRPKIGW